MATGGTEAYIPVLGYNRLVKMLMTCGKALEIEILQTYISNIGQTFDQFLDNIKKMMTAKSELLKILSPCLETISSINDMNMCMLHHILVELTQTHVPPNCKTLIQSLISIRDVIYRQHGAIEESIYMDVTNLLKTTMKSSEIHTKDKLFTESMMHELETIEHEVAIIDFITPHIEMHNWWVADIAIHNEVFQHLMTTGETDTYNEYFGYVRLKKMLMKCGKEVIRKLLQVYLSTTGQTFDHLLKMDPNNESINALFTTPKSPVRLADMDMHGLFLLVETANFPLDCKTAIKSLTSIRNVLIERFCTFAIDECIYIGNRNLLKTTLESSMAKTNDSAFTESMMHELHTIEHKLSMEDFMETLKEMWDWSSADKSPKLFPAGAVTCLRGLVECAFEVSSVFMSSGLKIQEAGRPVDCKQTTSAAPDVLSNNLEQEARSDNIPEGHMTCPFERDRGQIDELVRHTVDSFMKNSRMSELLDERLLEVARDGAVDMLARFSYDDVTNIGSNITSIFTGTNSPLHMYEQMIGDVIVQTHAVRVIIIGHFGVGKTSLARRLVADPGDVNDVTPTNGIEVLVLPNKLPLYTYDVNLDTFRESLHDRMPKECADLIKDIPMLQTVQMFADLSIWDFAGQHAFYNTHQVFLAKRAIYLLVTDISKSPSKEVEDESSLTSGCGKKWHPSDYVEFWLNSIHEFCQSGTDGGPPIILVATHADCLHPDTREAEADKYFTEIRENITNKEAIVHIEDEQFIVDNTIDDPNIKSLLDKIARLAKKQPYWGGPICMSWLVLEHNLKQLQTKGMKVLCRKDLKDVNAGITVPLKTDEEIEDFLCYENETGNLLYFQDDHLKEYILLDPTCLIDVCKRFITVKDSVPWKDAKTFKMWTEFKATAMLKQDFIDIIFDTDEFRDHRDVLLQFMEKLWLVAKPIQLDGTTEDFYFVPCVLEEHPPPSLFELKETANKESTNKLCFTNKPRFIPIAIFNKLLASCMKKWPLLQRKEKKFQIYCGCALFELGGGDTLCVYFYDSVVQVWVQSYKSPGGTIDRAKMQTKCLEVKRFIEDFFKSSARMKSPIEAFVKCEKSPQTKNEDMKQLTELVKMPPGKVLCTNCDATHAVTIEDLVYWWVDTHQRASEDVWADRTPTEKELQAIAQHIGCTTPLHAALGISNARAEQIQQDNPFVVNRIYALLCEWKKRAASGHSGTKNTLKDLQTALIHSGCNVDWDGIRVKIGNKLHETTVTTVLYKRAKGCDSTEPEMTESDVKQMGDSSTEMGVVKDCESTEPKIVDE